MKILINLDSITSQKTGIGHYTAQLLNELLDDPRIEHIVGFKRDRLYTTPHALRQQLDPANNATAEPNRLRKILQTLIKQSTFLSHLYRRLLSAYQARKIAPYAKQGYHYIEPNFIPVPYAGKTLPVIHDLSDLDCPQYHETAKQRWFARHLPQAIHQAARIITVSQYTKQNIIQRFSLRPDQIDIVSPGVADDFHAPTPEKINQICQQYRLKPNHYLLSVATLEPRKNLKSLFHAWRQLEPALRQRYPLVLVGKNGWLNSALEHEIQPYLADRQIILTGYVPQHHLPALYAGARLFCYLSYYEGYGMPIAEALLCHAPILASNTTSMPEVAGDYATYVDPNNQSQINQTLRHLLTQPRAQPPLPDHLRLNYAWKAAADHLYCALTKV